MTLVADIRRTFHRTRRYLCERAGVERYSKPGAYGLDDKLSKYLDFREGFYIEVGANDGYHQSNTYYLERFRGWRGILVEPIPALYRQCVRNRPRSMVFNTALVAADCGDNHVDMKHVNLMSFVVGALKTQAAEAEQVQQGLAMQGLAEAYSLRVPATTLERILDSVALCRPIDFLSLDVEGYEAQVLRGLNLRKYRPRYVLVEARFFEEVHKLLSADYDLIDTLTHHDYLYRLRGDGCGARVAGGV